MSRDSISVLIVCEDIQQVAFTRRYLERRGYKPRRIRMKVNPKGEGSGEQFVRETLAPEVQAYRQKSSYGKGGIALVAMIDADNLSIEQRIEQIDRSLRSEGLDRIQPTERIAIFVPERNIETWLRYANGLEIEPGQAYPKRRHQSTCKNEVEQFVNVICRTGPPADAPPSILHACEQLAKIL